MKTNLLENTTMSFGFINATDLEKAKGELVDYVGGFDGDLSGENGEGYTWESALELGYESTIEYLVNESDAKTVEELIFDVMGKVFDTYGSYDFTDWNFEKMPNGDYVIAFTSIY